MSGETKKSFKDIVERMAGPETDPVVYDFRRANVPQSTKTKKPDSVFNENAKDPYKWAEGL